MATQRVVVARRMAGTRENVVLAFIGRTVLYLVLVSGALIMIMPLIWMISTASKPVEETNLPEFYLLPSNFELLQNFRSAFARIPLARYFFNSIFVTVSATLGEVFLASMAGYSFARYTYAGRDLLFTLVLATLMIPFYVVVVPLYVVVYHFGWLDTYQALILPFMVSAFGVFLMRQFISTIPGELVDAGRIDGAGEFTIFVRIVLPLCLPAVATLTIFTVLSQWDSFVWPLLAVHNPEMYTVPLGLTYFQSEYLAFWNEQMAASLIALVPSFTMFLAFQRYFVQGVVMSGIKG
jgi:ABC-type glycerol-3-phosphate transport system permease component